VPQGLTDAEKKVYDLVARRFIAVFYPDCKFSTTTVEGTAGEVPFKTSGKEILEPGYRVVFAKAEKENNAEANLGEAQSNNAEANLGEAQEGEAQDKDPEGILPTFVEGESGAHQPTLTEKQTTPPPYYTEATLLRAMETAGKFVEDETLRAAMKENGIGRPSSRAGIIETLFKRHYIKRDRKRLVATPTGIELIDIIHEELLKSPELTGIWEKKLRDIEHKTYDAGTFINELKQQITEIVNQVLADNSNRKLS
jgi:DNA topoisomerase-3